jgi:dephospho-CoA kinase
MIKIGITGEMGSGKSFCSRLFGQLGVPVFYSDDIARTIINTNKELKEDLDKKHSFHKRIRTQTENIK